jgi:hypothetical protein
MAASHLLACGVEVKSMFLRRHIVPAAERLGIVKCIGRHTFRRTAASLLMFSSSSVKTTQEHAMTNIRMELYEQAVTGDKREAQNQFSVLMAGLLFRARKQALQCNGPLLHPRLQRFALLATAKSSRKMVGSTFSNF